MVSLSHKVMAADATESPLQQRGMLKAMEILKCRVQTAFKGDRRAIQRSTPISTTTPP
jgi:hypothetical protein